MQLRFAFLSAYEYVKYSRDGRCAILTAQHNPRGNLVEWNGTSFVNITSTLSNTANEIAFSPDGSYALITTISGSLLRVDYRSNMASVVPLTNTRLRGIDWHSR